MKNLFKNFIYILVVLMPSTLFAWKWMDLWQTPDQQAAKLLQDGKAQEAANVFENSTWKAVAQYRSGQYSKALQQFNLANTSDAQYNAGNAEAFLGNYPEAIKAYDKAIALNSNNSDAIFNREIVKKLLDKKNQQQNKSSSNKKDNQEDSKDNSPQNSADNQQEKDNQNSELNENQKQVSENAKDNSNSSKDSKDSKENKESFSGSQKQNAQQLQAEEDKNQILRRLPDDPGGLLRQKFLRDYFHRHSGENSSQGVS